MIVRPFSKNPHASWFRRGIVLDYVDGIVEALFECPEGHLAFAKMMAWDHDQDVRAFVVFEMPTEAFSDAENLLLEEERRWPFAFPNWRRNVALSTHVEAIVPASKNVAPDYLVVAERLDEEFLLSEAIDPAAEWKQIDWQGNLERGSANR